MDRIQIILHGENAQACRGAMESARSAALRQDRISFGLLLTSPPDPHEGALLRSLGQTKVLCPADDPWRSLAAVWQGESHVLMGHPTMRFDRGWDVRLLHVLNRLQRQRREPVMLTGCLPENEDPVDAVCPAAIASMAGERITLTKGTPLRYASEPIRSAFLCPDFCLARAEAFLRMADAPDLTLAAFRLHQELFTLHRPWIRLKKGNGLSDVDLSADPDTARRFCERFGIDRKEGKPGIMAQEGIFSPDLAFKARIPLATIAQEALRHMKHRRDKTAPLFVSAWLENPALPDMDRAMVRLRRLSAIRDLPLLCYAGGSNARRVATNHPNVLEYKERYGLTRPANMHPDDLARYARLCVPFLLAASQEKLLDHTHFVWIDMDLLAYPVYPGAALNWSRVCTDRIVMAMVDGAPDTSMISVPQERLQTLCKEVRTIAEVYLANTGRLPEEAEVWQMLIRDFPAWFRLQEMPKKGQLFALTLLRRGEEWLTK